MTTRSTSAEPSISTLVTAATSVIHSCCSPKLLLHAKCTRAGLLCPRLISCAGCRGPVQGLRRRPWHVSRSQVQPMRHKSGAHLTKTHCALAVSTQLWVGIGHEETLTAGRCCRMVTSAPSLSRSGRPTVRRVSGTEPSISSMGRTRSGSGTEIRTVPR